MSLPLVLVSCSGVLRRFVDTLPADRFGYFIETRASHWGVRKRGYLESLAARKWACDNGAFTGFDPLKFTILLDRLEGIPNCLFVVAPDVVADMKATLANFDLWEATIKAHGLPVALALQDGLTRDTAIPWDKLNAIFIGGTTAFKHSRIVVEVVAEAKRRGKWVHCGRVNAPRRLRYMAGIGVDSVDGSAYSKNRKHIRTAIKTLASLDTGQERFHSQRRNPDISVEAHRETGYASDTVDEAMR